MIDTAISHIANQLNQHLRASYDLAEDIVVVSNITEQDGTVGSHADNKLLLFLVNIEKDATAHSQSGGPTGRSDRANLGFPPVFLNLYLMFAGNFGGSNYMEALKFISNTISFFQRRPVFDHQVTPDLDPQIEKLTMQIENLDVRDLSNLWGVLSGKYLPSVLYKVRIIAYDSADVRTQVPTVRGPQVSAAL
jgi:hypothetical protein